MRYPSFALLWTAAAAHRQCGIAGIVGEDGFLDLQVTQGQCDTLLATDCVEGIEQAATLCPKDCPMAVPSPTFSCLFKCVNNTRGACADVNPNTEFANSRTSTCEASSVTYCRVASTAETCSECHQSFELSEDGRSCNFVVETRLNIGRILLVASLIIFLLILLAVLYSQSKAPSRFLVRNMKAVIQARRHRHVQDWNMFGENIRQRYSVFSMNVHKDMILGVGLALFYNSFIFQTLVHLFCLIGTHWVYSRSAIRITLKDTKAVTQGVEDADLTMCRDRKAGTIQDELSAFAEVNFAMLGGLYILLFLLSLAYGAYQKWHARWFDTQNSGMMDYAIQMQGFPPDTPPDEWFLKQKLEDEFKKIDPTTELVGVTLCYNYQDIREEVEGVMSRFTDRLDRVAGLYHQAYETNAKSADFTGYRGFQLIHDHHEDDVAVEEELRDAETVRGWFKNGKVKMTGELFAVFRHKQNMFTTLEKLNQNGGLDWSGTKIEVLHSFLEPPTVFWWHLGCGYCRFFCNLFIGVCKILLTISLLGLFLFWPMQQFIVILFSRTGTAPTGWIMMLIGTILGNVNMLLCINIWLSAFHLGFHRKDRMDQVIFVSNTILTLLNTAFNISLTIAHVAITSGTGTFEAFIRLESLGALGAQNNVARNMLNIQVPGGLFIGYLMMPVMAGIVPYFWNLFLMYLIYVWRALPVFLLRIFKTFLPWAPEGIDEYPTRSAEKGLEPMEVGLPWDYANNIIIPSVSFCMLFFVSPSTWKMFAWTTVWSLFVYCYYRVIHLRFNKAAFFTTPNLDITVNVVWGFPLSIVAAAWAHWGVIAGRFHTHQMAIAAFVASFLLWVSCYWFLVRPVDIKESGKDETDLHKTFEEVQEDTLYSWFNCNPMFVLKSKFCPYLLKDHVLPLGHDGKTICFYEAGKDYWFLDEEQRRKARAAGVQNDVLELETYLDPFIDLLENCFCPKQSAACASEAPPCYQSNVEASGGRRLSARTPRVDDTKMVYVPVHSRENTTDVLIH